MARPKPLTESDLAHVGPALASFAGMAAELAGRIQRASDKGAPVPAITKSMVTQAHEALRDAQAFAHALVVEYLLQAEKGPS
jgi:hypothetical protein